MSHQIVTIEGITVIAQENGDMKIFIHSNDLTKSLQKVPPLNSGTHVLIARKRSTLSAKGHSHDKPTAKICLVKSDEQTTPS